MCAQEFELKLSSTDSIFNNELSNLNILKKYNSKKRTLEICDSISEVFVTKGYFDNSYKTELKDSIIYAKYSYSLKFETILIHFNNEQVIKDVLDRNFIKHSQNTFEISIKQLDKLLNKFVSSYELNGFTFTSINLSNLKANLNTIEADLEIKSELKRNINKIIVNGYDEFPIKKLKKILNIENNSTFNPSSLNYIAQRLTESQHFNILKNPEALFTKDSTQIYIYAKKRSNSNFNGLIGFSNENEGKFQLNGYLNLHLSNVFNRAENISLNWIGNKQQKTLNINYNVPYIFNTNFNFESIFGIIRKDSTYVNSRIESKIGYHINNNFSIGVNLNTEKSDVTNKDSNPLINNFTKHLYGAYFKYSVFENNHISNTKFDFYATTNLGKRKNESINSNQELYSVNFKYIQKLNKKNYLLFKSNNTYLASDSTFDNELFAIGGFNSIRGFNEESILTSQFSANSIEHHYLTNSLSYLYSFFDFGLIKSTTENSTLNLYGFGIGYRFYSNKSIINIAYALGKFNNTSIQLQNSKFHIKISYPL